MSRVRKVVLFANYGPDGQQSMLRYAETVRRLLEQRGIAVVVRAPRRLLGPGVNPHAGLGKWLAYLDKLILFRPRPEPGPGIVHHVCDHSNALWLPRLRGAATVVTCHDLLAVRGALGEDPWCPASPRGRRLQLAILGGLGQAGGIACCSEFTASDVRRLTRRERDPLVRVIYNSQNDAIGGPLRRPARDVVDRALPELAGRAYVLHVGSGLPRKNRVGVVRAAASATALGWSGAVVFAGDAAGAAEHAAATGLPPGSILSARRPGPELLRALYSAADALVFPSHGEGFGYPIIEAQACGCPVICSDATSVPEIAGAGALVHPPADAEGMGRSIVEASRPETRARLIAAGTANLPRFAEDRIVEQLLDLYRAVLARSGHSP